MVEIFEECSRSMSKGMYYDQLSSSLGLGQTSTQEAKPLLFFFERIINKGPSMQSFITKITRSEKFSAAIPSSKWNEANIRIMNMTMGWNSSHKIFLEISLLRSIQHVPFSYQSQVMIGGMHIQIINSCQSDKTIRFLIQPFSLTTRASRVCHTFIKN